MSSKKPSYFKMVVSMLGTGAGMIIVKICLWFMQMLYMASLTSVTMNNSYTWICKQCRRHLLRINYFFYPFNKRLWKVFGSLWLQTNTARSFVLCILRVFPKMLLLWCSLSGLFQAVFCLFWIWRLSASQHVTFQNNRRETLLNNSKWVSRGRP